MTRNIQREEPPQGKKSRVVGPVIVYLRGLDPEADARAVANGMALRDDLQALADHQGMQIVIDPPPQRNAPATRRAPKWRSWGNQLR